MAVAVVVTLLRVPEAIAVAAKTIVVVAALVTVAEGGGGEPRDGEAGTQQTKARR